MKNNSVEGYAKGHARTDEIAAADAAGLERSCSAASTSGGSAGRAPDGSAKGAPDGIVQAPSSRGIERIEARFHGLGFEPHRHDTYAIGLTLSGVQTFQYRGAARASLPGNVIVLHPDEVHDGAAGTDAGLRYRMLYLPPERLIEAAGGSRGLPFVPNPIIADAEFRQCLAEALDDLEAEPRDLLLDDLIDRMATSLWRHADGRGGAPGTPRAQQAVLRCRDYLQANSDRTISSEELEEVSGLDRYTTARQFRKLLGTSPHRYLVMRRLDRAKVLLSQGGTLADVAVDTGFADQAHFTRHFKKTFGMTPGRWMALTRSA
ncbi:AraC family transcriptional regulator [Neorhizobium galegae]|uniref:AraC family transcriptional regulator n=1 Tax=Neorhizobium galegae TaxID=399 RepID=UPI00062278F3|nr:AraC family transcriptional regulator [Neorhizobium galegae]MCQ1767620.1 AraC family transcriptional regulator [Neorhizobium galegae]MCQ1847959.1 AraC family transcriptional regulator [Neorhizobium galegae]CDZ37922.1 L-rhamnose operon transcriptional activator RhaR [Neorhizobium galegae bv. officinalis]